MALDITALDITVDESIGLTDNDVDKTVAPYSTDPTVQYLLSLDTAGGLTSPEVAFKADFITATATGRGTRSPQCSLTQSLSGTPFSTTVGVNSGIQTVDGNYVWLFLDPSNSNVVRGVIGTSEPGNCACSRRSARFLVRADQHQHHHPGPVSGPVCGVVPSGYELRRRAHRSDEQGVRHALGDDHGRLLGRERRAGQS